MDDGRLARLRDLGDCLSGPAPVVRSVALAPFDPAEDNARARAWKAMLLRQAYRTDWLPGEVAVNIRHVRFDCEHWRVELELLSGTVIRDTGDRIDVIGDPDDIAVDEVVAAVLRRNPPWDAVELHGDVAFRRAAAWRLLAARPGMVIADLPLTDAEAEAARLGLAPPATHRDEFLELLAGGHPVQGYRPPDEQ